MYVTDSTGRAYRLPTAAEEARIRAGIAADPDAVELTEAQLAELRPWSEMRSQIMKEKKEQLVGQLIE